MRVLYHTSYPCARKGVIFMYEHFKNDFLVQIQIHFNQDQIKVILNCLDVASYNYDVSKKQTEIVEYGNIVPELVKTYLVCKKIDGLSEQTLYNYHMHLRNFFMFIRKGPENISANDIRIYLYKYQEIHGITNRSLDKIRQVISGFFQWAQNEEYILKNPTKNINQIKYELKPRQALSQIDLEYIRRACKTLRESAMIEVLYSTGCRVSELSILKISDIDFAEKNVHLFGKGRKHRLSYLNAKAEVALKDYLKSRTDNSEYLFVTERRPIKNLNKEAIEKIVRNISKRVFGDRKKVTPHIFRHTTATTAMKNGMPIQSIQIMLGHSRIDTTMIYAHSDDSLVKYEHEKTVI